MALTVKKTGETQVSLARAMLPWFALAVILTILQIIPEAPILLRFDRSAIADGQIWRLLTANFVHLGWSHLAFNGAGLLAVGWLFAEDGTAGEWAFILVFSGIAASLGMYFWTPEVSFCVGLSGALHGLFSAGCLIWIREGVGVGFGLLLALVIKLTYEQTAGSMPFSEGLVGGPVVTDAHLWGAIAGIIAISILWLRSMLRARL
jgi:rhomboid family GlyGly-CTERM serine protease